MTKITEDREVVPSWLTKQYVEGILRRKNPEIHVKSFTAVPPVAAGNNYASLILRAEAICEENGSEKVHSLIIKTIHCNEESAELLSEFGAHENEMKMYSKILPRMQKLLLSIGDTEKLAPAAIFVDEVYKAMIFEDLKPLDYKMADRKVGLDWEHVQIIARKLAKFHACSMVLMEQGESFEKFDKPFITADIEGFNNFFVTMTRDLGKTLENWSKFEKYGEKMTKLSTRIISQGIELFKKKPGQTMVLNHGDSWLANMLFKYDKNGQIKNAALIDFQLGYFSSPVFDLMYFYCTSANDSIKFNPLKFSEMLKVYHTELSKTLTKLKSSTKIPTLFELHQEYYQRGFGFIIYVLVSTVMMNDDDSNQADMNVILGDSDQSKEYRRKLFLNPRAIETIKYFLPLWDAQGLLDPLH